VWEQIELLKDHANFCASFVNIAINVREFTSEDNNGAACWLLQHIDATKQCALAGTRWSDDAHNLTALDVKIDTA
jgi:hypothetical protein